MRIKLSDIVTVVQFSTASHQKNLKVLQNYYEKVSLDEFIGELFHYLKNILCSIQTKKSNVQRILEFLAKFVSLVTPVEDEDFQAIDVPHPFLTKIIMETLKYHDVVYDFVRYNSCLFVRLILHHIGTNINLDNEVCDSIEEAMLERTQDPKASVRLQAVMALLRLQVPMNPDCPVITAFLALIVDSNAMVRAEIVRTIAPCPKTIPRIVDRLCDVDAVVRTNSFRRCSDLGPKYFKIVERQRIMRCGLGETHTAAKKVFVENLLTKWLNAYGEDLLLLLKALKLDADENDVASTQEVSKEVVAILLGTVPFKNVSEALSLEKKLIPLDELSSEKSTLWNKTVSYLRQHDEMDEELEAVVPELTSFCNYIESLYDRVKKNQMETWEYLDYQATLNNLFEILEGYDLSDEVGRKTLYQLTLKLMREENLQFKIKRQIMSLAAQAAPKSEDFMSTVCHVISDIREPMTESQDEPVPNTMNVIDRDCRRAELKVKIIKLTAQLEDATDRQEFLAADSLKQEINQLKNQLAEFAAPLPAAAPEPTAPPPKDDTKTTCHCLDLLIALLELPSTKKMTSTLITAKDEFVVPLLESNMAEINSRVLNCLAVFCFLDDGMVERCVKILSIPIFTYRRIPNYNKNALLISVKAIADLFHQYGAVIFGNNDDIDSVVATTNGHTMRKLYTDETVDGNASDDSPVPRFHLESVIEVMLDMLDDEDPEIREVAAKAITKLVMYKFPVSPSLITRIILKWYNPMTVSESDKMHQLLGLLIIKYSSKVQGARDIIIKAIIPILNGIVNAPHTSPLVDVDVDNLLKFLAVITDFGNTHLTMAHMFCYEIVKKKNANIVQHLCKLMLHLEVPTENNSLAKELVTHLEVVLDEQNCSLEKTSQRNLTKFLEKVKASMETTDNLTKDHTLYPITEESGTNDENNEQLEDSDAEESAEKNPQRAGVTENQPDSRKRDRRSAIASTSSSETEDQAKSSPKRRSKKLKVQLTRLKEPLLQREEPTKEPEASGEKKRPGRPKIQTRRKKAHVDSENSEIETKESGDSELDENKTKKKPKLDLKRNEKGEGKRKGKGAVEKCQESNRNKKIITPNDQENNQTLNDSSRTTRSSSKILEDLNSSNETILHTIIHDISQEPEINDISSFNCSNDESISSRKSLRLSAASSNHSSPIIETMAKKLDRTTTKKKTECSKPINSPLKKSTKNDEQSKPSSKRRSKDLKVQLTRLEEPLLQREESTKEPEASAEKKRPGRPKIQTRRKKAHVDSENSEIETKESGDSELDENKTKKKPKLDLKRNEKGEGKKKGKDAVDKSEKSNRNQKNITPNGQENNESPNGVERITRNSSKILEDLNSSNETILLTIIHDISQEPEINDISSFNCSNDESISSRKSLRLSAASSNHSSPIIEATAKKLERTTRQNTGYTNAASKRSLRKVKKK